MDDRKGIVESVTALIDEELDDDFVELWSLAWSLRFEAPLVTPPEMAQMAEAVMRELVRGDVTLVRLDAPRSELALIPSADPVGLVMEQWRALERDPEMGELGWMVRNVGDHPGWVLVEPPETAWLARDVTSEPNWAGPPSTS
jgi:hypothetical protein